MALRVKQGVWAEFGEPVGASAGMGEVCVCGMIWAAEAKESQRGRVSNQCRRYSNRRQDFIKGTKNVGSRF